ncbi:MAG: 30S ribosomal protein S4 [Candidatus Komeilibacteria bacterium CG_4_10_14_0_2_um_filter_37_10]|uniref:Small ribosomal subunit protein uS4 n=1 Tax=Candidatus Komeilibacteria bacterium CG_4_10_14_0_2_um_filter_37_10 TaxID=1974470 RepID=A0A2M7VDU7_9BACT|nr:MAG: 30S ribosomal protein S4 [Candidatus Komeilibacteria bacterium CG_4_10_14_0_2_um_filter_37_10]
MGRYTGPKWKLSRREGIELRDEGKRALAKRNYVPGAHGPTNKSGRLSGYGKHLREKQKAKRIYGLYEKQFRNTYNLAVKNTGDTSVNLCQLLESRLDNIVYRIGWATSRSQARQLVSHGHITIDGQKVNIPSYQTKVGSQISVKPSYQKKTYWQGVLGKMEKKNFLSNLNYDHSKHIATITSKPDMQELAVPFDPTLIIEFYSK